MSATADWRPRRSALDEFASLSLRTGAELARYLRCTTVRARPRCRPCRGNEAAAWWDGLGFALMAQPPRCAWKKVLVAQLDRAAGGG
ncbi:hypothetical protein HBB16_14670 [Pseudonocardia sp. MCCB 268]|nr:hypothetical protein [Pseudonocardia cytotoxica]